MPTNTEKGKVFGVSLGRFIRIKRIINMDTPTWMLTAAVSLSIVSLCVSAYSIYAIKKIHKSSQRMFEVEYSNTLIPNLEIKGQNGQTLSATFNLINHGKSSLMIDRIKLAGHAKSSIGDEYSILNDSFGFDGEKRLAAGQSLDFDTSFIVGHGTLKSASLIAFVSGTDLKHEVFRIALPVRVRMS